MKCIPLTKNEFSLVDDEDFEYLSKFKWHARKSKRDSTWYAGRGSGPKKKMITILMHREIMKADNLKQVDHINRNGLDNRKCNLRLCTASQNAAHRKSKLGISKLRGVVWNINSKKWISSIKINGKRIHLGCFQSKINAARAYDNAAKNLFKEFSFLNDV